MWQNAPIDMAMYYNARITSSYGGLFDPLTWGPAKTFYSFKAFNSLYKLENQVRADSDDYSLLTVAARKDQEVAVMISNYSDQDKLVNIEGLGELKDEIVYVIDENKTLELMDCRLEKKGVIKKETVLLIVGKL